MWRNDFWAQKGKLFTHLFFSSSMTNTNRACHRLLLFSRVWRTLLPRHNLRMTRIDGSVRNIEVDCWVMLCFVMAEGQRRFWSARDSWVVLTPFLRVSVGCVGVWLERHRHKSLIDALGVSCGDSCGGGREERATRHFRTIFAMAPPRKRAQKWRRRRWWWVFLPPTHPSSTKHNSITIKLENNSFNTVYIVKFFLQNFHFIFHVFKTKSTHLDMQKTRRINR